MEFLNATKKGQIWLSAVSYVLITIIIIVLLLNTGLPLLEKVRDKSIYSRTKEVFLDLNEQIKDVQAEGPGSQRVIPIEIPKGTLAVENNQIKWTMESKAKIIEPRTKILLGDLIIGDDSFITLEDTREYLDEEFNELLASTWATTGTCNVRATSGSLVYTDAACGTIESVSTHDNYTTTDGLSLEFKYEGGTSISSPADAFYVGFGSTSTPWAPTGSTIVGGFLFNGTSSNIETMESSGGIMYRYTCTSYSADTTYYGKIVLNDTVPQYFISTDEETWQQCPNENTSKASSLKAAVVAFSGSASIDDLRVHDNRYHINNSYIAVDINKFAGTRNSFAFINTTRLIANLYSTLTNTTVVGNFTFRINDVPASEQGNGFVELSELRTDPDAAVIIAHVNSTNYEYDLILTLEGGVDFIQINVQNLVIR